MPEPTLQRAFQRFADDLVAGRIMLFRDGRGTGMKLADGAKRDDARIVAKHPVGRELLARLADMIESGTPDGSPTSGSRAERPPTMPVHDSDPTVRPGGGPAR